MARPQVGDWFPAGAVGDASPEDVRENRTFTSEKSGVGVKGIMPVISPGTKTLSNEGDEYKISQGYHDGTGNVKVNINNLVPENIRKGANVGSVVGTSPIPLYPKLGILYYPLSFTLNGGFYGGDYLKQNIYIKTIFIHMLNNSGGVYQRTKLSITANSEELFVDENYINIADGRHYSIEIPIDKYFTSNTSLRVTGRNIGPDNGTGCFILIGVEAHTPI